MHFPVSFEIFPPRTPKAAERLEGVTERLSACSPDFISVTYGAGGTTREVSIRTAENIAARTDTPVAGHLTCVGTSKEAVRNVASDYRKAGVNHIVALRGDPETGIGTAFKGHPEGFGSAAELVGDLRKTHPDVRISVSAYPERHPESQGWDADIRNLKNKIDRGADDAITQFFFDADIYARFLERLDRAGIVKPVIAGILPIQNFEKTCGFAEKCGTSVPAWLRTRYENAADGDAAKLAVETTANLIDRLIPLGQRHFHIYAMNTADVPVAVHDYIRSLAPATRVSKVPETAPEAA